MRILYITPLFQPEPSHIRGIRFTRRLGELGHEVQVLTGFPNYPEGKLYPGYRMRLWQRELMDGTEVVRVPLVPSHDRSAIRRIVSYISLALSMSALGPFLLHRADIVFLAVGPMTLTLPAILLKWLWRVPFVLNVADLWPESVTSSGMMPVRWSERVISAWCRFSYRQANHIVVISEGFHNVLAKRGALPENMSVVYDWCDPSQEETGSAPVPPDTFHLKDGFNVVYAGNLGELQALGSVLLAAELLRDQLPGVRFVFVGGGTQEATLKKFASEHQLTNVMFIPRMPVQRLREVLFFASVLLVHLKDDPYCRIVIPQKTQASMACGVPVLAAVKGEASRLIERSGGGYPCPPESPEALAATVERFARLPKDELQAMGRKGHEFYMQHLCFDVGVRRMAGVMEMAAATHGRSA